VSVSPYHIENRTSSISIDEVFVKDNYAFPTGFEEVEKILAAKPLKPIE